jgi:hypothetical protein
VGVNWFWRLPDAYGDYAHAQKFSAVGFQECRVQDVCWYFYAEGLPQTYTYQSKVSVYTDAGGLPGTELASILIGPGTGTPSAFFPAPTCVDFEPESVFVTGGYWVAVESFAPDPTTGIRTLSDNGGGGCIDGLAENYLGTWELLWPYWGGGMPQDIADIVEVFHCCAPYTGRSCGPGGDDWPTYQHDYARTGASFTALGDAWNDLTVDWIYTDPGGITDGVAFAGPIIAFGRVICSFTNKYMVFDLDGTLLYTLSGGPLGTGNIRNTPTVDVIGTDTLLFVAGGGSQRAAAYNLNTGGFVWQTAALGSNVRYSRFTLVDIGGGTIGVFFGLENGRIYGVNAATGATLAGYPVILPAQVLVAGATDGTQLFYNTYSTTLDGDIYALDAATGATNWSYVAANPPNGLEGDDLWPVDLPEGFYSGISYDAVIDAIYTCSRQTGVTSGTEFPTDGIMYSADAGSGVKNWATLANRGYLTCPIIDANSVYMPNFSTWVGPVGGPGGGYLLSFDKFSGGIAGAYNAPAGHHLGYRRYYVDFLLTCEPENSDYPEDLLFGITEEGWFSCVQSVSFNEIYRRRIDHNDASTASDIGMAGAIGSDEDDCVHLVFSTYWGDLIDMKKCETKQADRPRLELQTYNPILPVEFGPAASLIDTSPDVFTNTGGAVLTIEQVQVDENTFGNHIPFFSAPGPGENEFLDRAEKIADKLQREAYLSKYLRLADTDGDNILSGQEIALGKETMNRAGAAFPPFLNAVLHPTAGDMINPGDTMDIVLDIIQTAINRGPQVFYMLIDSDDPDFFLNDTVKAVEMSVTLVGGCLVDTTELHFGVSQANTQWVTNTGRLGTEAVAFDIDGDDASYYQGAYVYGVSTYRIATNVWDWLSGGGEADAFISLQADPNWCDNSCKPYLDVGVSLGEWSLTGTSYETIIGDLVCKSFLDSVQNFGGDWENFGAPFDNDSTMGLYVNGRVVGAYELSPSGDPIPELANVTLEILEFTERNGDSVPNWYLGEIYDCDNGGDTVGIDRDISTAWTYNRPAADQAWGQIKIPFGCGYEPILNTWGTYGVSGTPGHGFFGWGIWWDQCYDDMAAGTGLFQDGPAGMSAGDGEALVTFASKHFGPSETMTLGIAHFGLHNLADASSSAELAPLAKRVNKWAGFGRGDVNDDDVINLADIIYLAAYVNSSGPGPVPFKHLGDVNNSDPVNHVADAGDVQFLIDYYFFCGACPVGDWIF